MLKPSLRRLLLSLSLVLLLVSVSASATRTTAQTKAIIYLPLAIQPQLLIVSQLTPFSGNQYTSSMIGEVKNVSATTAFSVTLEAHIETYYEHTLYTETIQLALPVTLPGHSNPFLIGLLSRVDQVQQVTIVRAVPITTPHYQSLTVIPQAIDCSDELHLYGRLDGIVRNDTPTVVHSIQVEIWGLNDESNRGMFFSTISAPLQPGAETPFSADVSLCYIGGPLRAGVMLEKFQYEALGIVDP